MINKIHKIKRRIYYEHTDGVGVVYYARYLYFLEQARTEVLRNCGFNQESLLKNYNLIFVVKSLKIDYLKPAILDDKILIESKISSISQASLSFEQKILNESQDFYCISAQVKIACLNLEFKPIKLPNMLKIALKK